MHILPKKITKYPLFVRAFFWKQKRTYGESSKAWNVVGALAARLRHARFAIRRTEPEIIAARCCLAVADYSACFPGEPLRVLYRHQFSNFDQTRCLNDQSRSAQ